MDLILPMEGRRKEEEEKGGKKSNDTQIPDGRDKRWRFPDLADCAVLGCWFVLLSVCAVGLWLMLGAAKPVCLG